LKCPNCGCEEFHDEATTHENYWGVGKKYICKGCGFKGSKEMMKNGMMKKTYLR